METPLTRPRLSALIHDRLPHPREGGPSVLGILKGEGIGPEVVDAALTVLWAVESRTGCHFETRTGGAIGTEAEALCGAALSDEVVALCAGVFADGGAVLAGPGGGRFVYDLRRRFDLFCKLSPVVVYDELQDAGRMKPSYTKDVDLMVIRESASGIYLGRESEELADAGRTVHHRFAYSEREVERLLRIAARIAAARRGRLAVVVKSSGLPALSALWSDCMERVARESGVRHALVDVDYAVYLLLQEARELDVVVAPNLFGDVLSDLGGVLLGSRGLCYGASFASQPFAVYQTNHGAAWDRAGSDRANPMAQILSLAMMLRESYALPDAADAVENAVREVWRRGWRSEDLAAPGCRTAGARDLGELVAETVAEQAT